MEERTHTDMDEVKDKIVNVETEVNHFNILVQQVKDDLHNTICHATTTEMKKRQADVQRVGAKVAEVNKDSKKEMNNLEQYLYTLVREEQVQRKALEAAKFRIIVSIIIVLIAWCITQTILLNWFWRRQQQASLQFTTQVSMKNCIE